MSLRQPRAGRYRLRHRASRAGADHLTIAAGGSVSFTSSNPGTDPTTVNGGVNVQTFLRFSAVLDGLVPFERKIDAQFQKFQSLFCHNRFIHDAESGKQDNLRDVNHDACLEAGLRFSNGSRAKDRVASRSQPIPHKTQSVPHAIWQGVVP